MTGPVTRDPGDTPGESEFSWGPGLMPDPEREPPHPYHNKIAASKTNRNSEDATYVENYEGFHE